jgi:hypothetical protein
MPYCERLCHDRERDLREREWYADRFGTMGTDIEALTEPANAHWTRGRSISCPSRDNG